jgi:HD-GYP domain-containing protein (c-di-GMP phosphodiesterase class II)
MMETLENGGADQSYTMALNGVVDAAVNGGLANYVSFLNGEYRNINPEIAQDVDSFEAKKDCSQVLSALVKQQIELMDKGIKIHSLKVCEAMKPLGQHMEGNYQKMRKDALYWAGDQKK